MGLEVVGVTLEIVGVPGLCVWMDDVRDGAGEELKIFLHLVDEDREGIDWDERDGL